VRQPLYGIPFREVNPSGPEIDDGVAVIIRPDAAADPVAGFQNENRLSYAPKVVRGGSNRPFPLRL
jgi:hypothetical protein